MCSSHSPRIPAIHTAICRQVTQPSHLQTLDIMLRTGRMGDLTWPIIRDKVDAAVTVSESEIVDAMRMVFERMKVPASSQIP